VCRLTPLSPEEIADLKLAITEAANDYVDESRPLEDESRVSFSFRLLDDRLAMELSGPGSSVSAVEQELSRAIIEATVDECSFSSGRTLLVKYLSG
jgi:anti-sigma regulatory factor (Ser/Thr protein kinase)